MDVNRLNSNLAETSEWNPETDGISMGVERTNLDSVGLQLPSDSDGCCSANNYEASVEILGVELGQVVRCQLNNCATDLKLTKLLGIGGMGRVYEAKLERTNPQGEYNQKFAIKLAKKLDPEKQNQKRLSDEAEFLSRLDHPYIVRFVGNGKLKSGEPFIAMDRVDGTNVVDFFNENHFTLTQKVRFFIKICHAIEHCHSKGIVHRDIKPANILVDKFHWEPVLIDFGIAKACALSENLPLSPNGEIPVKAKTDEEFIGTIQYMSPEQARPEQYPIDHRSDIYSLGALFFEVLTGDPLIDNSDLESESLEFIFDRIAANKRPLLNSVLNDRFKTTDQRLSECLELILDKAIHVDPEMRFNDVSDFRIELETALRSPSQFLRQKESKVRFHSSPAQRRSFSSVISSKVGHYFWQSLSACLLLALIFAIRSNLTPMHGSIAHKQSANSKLELPGDLSICESDVPPPESKNSPIATPAPINEVEIHRIKFPASDFSQPAPQSVQLVKTELKSQLSVSKTFEHKKIRRFVMPNKLHYMIDESPQLSIVEAKNLPIKIQNHTIVNLEKIVRKLDNQTLTHVRSLIPRIPPKTLYKCFHGISEPSQDPLPIDSEH